MRGLIIKSPYIDDILSGIKKIEVRGSNTKIRERIVLLKSGTNLALGTVEIYDSKKMTLLDYINWDYNKLRGKFAKQKMPYKNTYGWKLKNPIIFKEPIPYIHPLGAMIWVTLPNNFID